MDFLYRLHAGTRVGRALSTPVDVVRFAFFAYAVVLTWQMMQKIGPHRMAIIDLPMNVVYGVVPVGFACCDVRSVQVALAPLAAGLQRARAPRACASVEEGKR